MNLKCSECGKDFWRRVSHVGVTVFCSKKCFATKRVTQCYFCEKELILRRSLLRQKNFCNKSCRMKWQNSLWVPKHRKNITCLTCRKIVNRKKSVVEKSNKHFCSSSCYRKVGGNNPRWKGGKTFDRDGYVTLWMPSGKIKEHRLVIEKRLGRKLRKNEVVHHKNENKSDNRACNLQIMTASEHARFHRLNKKA